MSTPAFVWTVGSLSLSVQLAADGEGRGTARVGEREYAFRVLSWQTDGGLIEWDGRRLRFRWAPQASSIALWLEGHYYHLTRVPAAPAAAARPAEGGNAVVAPMPGTIIQVSVREGEAVAAHHPLLVMESMKMESILRAPRAGRVRQVRCRPGEVVEMGQTLIELGE